MKILNLYAGIGGNRKLWDRCQVTAVENDTHIALTYSQLYPQDNLVLADAHQYLLDHFQDYDFIWASPPCPTHSRMRTSHQYEGGYHYPDMKLYEEIIFLKTFYEGHWVIENVISYYDPLITPTATLDRHYFWANFHIDKFATPKTTDVSRATKSELEQQHQIILPEGTRDQRKLLRNAVHPLLGKHIFDSVPIQTELFTQ